MVSKQAANGMPFIWWQITHVHYSLQHSQKEKYKISWRRERRREGGKGTFPSSVAPRVASRAAASMNQPGKATLCASSSLETTKMFSVIIFTLFRVLVEKTLNIHQGKPETGGSFIVLAHLCQGCGSNSEQRPNNSFIPFQLPSVAVRRFWTPYSFLCFMASFLLASFALFQVFLVEETAFWLSQAFFKGWVVFSK